MTLSNLTLAATLTLTALIAGLYYGYLCSVNPGLHKLSDAEYVAAMQSINRAIQNPVFFLSFFGTLVLLPVSAYLNYQPNSMRFYLLVAAAVLYATGSFGLTVVGNVPLNETLDKFDLQSANASGVHYARLAFEPAWNVFHSIRTFATIGSLVLAALACVQKSADLA